MCLQNAEWDGWHDNEDIIAGVIRFTLVGMKYTADVKLYNHNI